MVKAIKEDEIIRQTYPLRTVRAAICLYGAGSVARLQDSDIEDMLKIETEGMVALWRARERGGSWEGKRAWVESEVDAEEEDVRPFETDDERILLRETIDVAGILLRKCKAVLQGDKGVEFVVGEKPTARNITEGIQRAHVIIHKDAARLRELEASVRDERQIEKERIQRILRRALLVMKLTPEQLEELRKEFPGMLPVVSEVMPRIAAEA